MISKIEPNMKASIHNIFGANAINLFFATLLAILFLPSAAWGRIPIEAVQREFQARYYFINGTYVYWSADKCGYGAPFYPPDGFYGDLDNDPEFAAILVQNLAEEFYALDPGESSVIPVFNYFIDTPDGHTGIEGQTTLTLESPPAPSCPPTGSGFDMSVIANITTANYVTCFAVLKGYIEYLNYVGVAVYPAKVDPSGNDVAGGSGNQETVCATAISDAHSMAPPDFTSWTHNGWTNIGTADAPPVGIYTSLTVFTNTSTHVIWYGASKFVYRQYVASDPGNQYPYSAGGTVTEYINVASETNGLGSFTPPVTADGKFHLFASASIGPGGASAYNAVWQAGPLPAGSGNNTYEPTIDSTDCGTNITKGWQIQPGGYYGVYAPIFPTDADNVQSSCHPGDPYNPPPQQACTAWYPWWGNCLCPQLPGLTFVQTGSLDVRINLGLGNFGDWAGSLTLHADQPSAALYSASSLHHPGFPSSSYSMYTVTLTNGYSLVFSNLDLFTPTWVSSVTVTNDGNTNHCFIVEQLGPSATPKITQFNYTAATTNWTMLQGGGSRTESRTTYWSTPTNRTDSIVVQDNNGVVASQTTEQYQQFPWGPKLTQRTLGTGGTARTTTWTRYQASDGTNNYGQVKQMVEPSGRWERYQYDGAGRLNYKVAQFGDNAITSADNLNRVTSITRTETAAYTIMLTVEQLLGNEISRAYEVHSVDTNGIEQIQSIRCVNAGAAINDAANLTNIVWRNTSGTWDITQTRNEDGTMSFYQYVRDSDLWLKTVTVQTGAPNSTQTTIVDGTQTTTVTGGLHGEPISEQVQDIVSGITLSQKTYGNYDVLLRPGIVTYLDGTTESWSYACCGLDTATDRDGVTTQYIYDAARRKIGSTRLSITTTNLLDAAGNVLKTVRVGTDGTTNQMRSASYDLNGSVLTETNALGGVTSYTQVTNSAGETVITNIYPDGGTSITTYYQDGTALKVSGTAVNPTSYIYGAQSDGGVQRAFTTTVKLDSNGGTNEWTKTYTDMLDRGYKTVYAAASGTPYSVSYYNLLGQLTNEVDPDGVSMIYEYNPKGEQVLQVLDMNQNYAIDYAGSDRITFTTNDVVVDNGVNVKRTRTYVWDTIGSDTSKLISTVETSADGLTTLQSTWNNGAALTSTNVTVYVGGGNRYQTNLAPDGSYSLGSFQNDRLISSTRFDAGGNQIGQSTYGYDAHGRQNTVVDARAGTSTYYFNNLDTVNGMKTPTPVQVTTNFFDTMGRLIATTLPDNSSVTNVFYPTGKPRLTYGSRTYPVGYSYDAQGRQKAMTNWSAFSALSGGRVTTWNYDPYRGFLIGKVYDGNTAGPVYTYTAAGRLWTRLWVRGTNTTYLYNTAGDLTSISYNDGFTAAVTTGYDRSGRQSAITNDATICTLAYNDAGNVLAEVYSGGPLNGISITNGYDTLLRRTNLSTLNSTTPLLQTSYGYDAASRLLSVSDGTNSATYLYLANSPLVSQITFKQNGSTRMTTSKSYDNLNRLTSTGSSNATPALLDFHGYAYNDANQRISVTNTDGTYWVYQYDNLGQVTSGVKYWPDNTVVAGQQFGYNFDTIGNRTSTASGGDQWGSNLRYASYSANSLDQYTSRTVPGAVDIIGTATNTATVTVNDIPAYRKASYYRVQLPLANASGSVYQSVTNLAVLNNGTSADIQTNITGNVLFAPATQTFQYDSDGNLTNDSVWVYLWDAENRLVSMSNITAVATAARKKLDFSYDYQGRRVQKIVSTNSGSAWVSMSTNRFAYDGWNLSATLNPDLSVLKAIMWGLDLSTTLQEVGGVGGLLKINVQGTNSLGCSDWRGNVTTLVDASSSNVTGQYEYGPFGEAIRATGPMAKANPLRFSTQYQDDETDVFLYPRRPYNPSTGRFLSRDPVNEIGDHFVRTGVSAFAVGLTDSSPVGDERVIDVNEGLRGVNCNVFSISGNDGINFIDYLGLSPFCICIRASHDHAWIRVTDATKAEVHTYGRYKMHYGHPPVDHSGVIRDWDLRRSYTVERCKSVNSFKPTINSGYEVHNNNCVTYASSEWKRATGESLPHRGFSMWLGGHFDDPDKLMESISKANAKDPKTGDCCSHGASGTW